MVKPQVTIEDFEKLDIRVGRILAVEPLPNAKYTTHKLTIDFGKEVGQKISGARVISYKEQELIGKQVLGIVNLPERQIGKLFSQSLTLGVLGDDNECVLITVDKQVPLGGKLY